MPKDTNKLFQIKMQKFVLSVSLVLLYLHLWAHVRPTDWTNFAGDKSTKNQL